MTDYVFMVDANSYLLSTVVQAISSIVVKNMNTYLGLFMIAMLASVVLTPLVRRACERGGWLDEPAQDGRRVHRQAIPRLGGVALFASVAIALAALPLIDNLVTQTVRENSAHLFIIFVPAALVFLFGVYDDVRGTGALAKFGALAVAGALFYALGGRVEAFSVPLVGSVELTPWLSFVITVVWIVGIANAFNLIDGIDGLAAGAALFASLVMLVVSLMLGHSLVAVVAVVLCGALIGFLRYNFNPASIFLGDSGSLFVGFLLAALSVQGTQKASTAVAVAIPLLAFGVPVIDTGFTLVRRFLSGRPLFRGDREHIHHMLLARGWSQRRVAFVLYGACAVFGLLALLFVNETGRATGLMLFIVGMAVALAVGRLRYHEVDEIKASMKRNLGDRRLRAANNIGIRRASRTMSEAETLDALFGGVREMLELGEFVYATVQLGGAGDAERIGRALEGMKRETALSHLELRDERLCWSWERGDIEAADIIGSGRFWTLRLPLSTKRAAPLGYINLYRSFDSDVLMLDINYICDLFQREMSHAVERILRTAAAAPRPVSPRDTLAYEA